MIDMPIRSQQDVSVRVLLLHVLLMFMFFGCSKVGATKVRAVHR